MFLFQWFSNARFLYFTHIYMYGQFKTKMLNIDYWVQNNNVIYLKFWQSSQADQFKFLMAIDK